MSAPAFTAVKAVQDPSGVGEPPMRTSMVTDVPPGACAATSRVCQSAAVPAFSTRDVKMPVLVAAAMRTRSTVTLAPPAA